MVAFHGIMLYVLFLWIAVRIIIAVYSESNEDD
jgi:hypothetical protein